MTLLCLFLCLSLNAVLSSCTFGTKTLQQFDDCTTLCDVLGGVLGGHSEDSCPPKCSEWIDVQPQHIKSYQKPSGVHWPASHVPDHGLC